MKITLSRRALGRRSAVFALGLSVAAATFSLSAPAASARSYLGGVDMNEACHHQYDSSYHATLLSGNVEAYEWFCVTAKGYPFKSIDVDKYCKWKYESDAYADPQGLGAYDWACYK